MEKRQLNSFVSSDSKEKLSSEILFDIIENVVKTYEEDQKKTKQTIKKPLFSMPFRSKPKPIFLSNFAETYDMPTLRTLDYYNNTSQNNFSFLKHLEVHKQFVPNLCGYHTLFNMLEICKLLKRQDLSVSPKEIFNPAKFWKFHFECIKYLQDYAELYCRDQNELWKPEQIRYGDLERQYVKPLTTLNKKFKEIMSPTEDFQMSQMTFEFQFNKLVYSTESLDKMQEEINVFVQARKPVHNVKMIMMGITNHWFLFMAHKYMDHVEFWMLDSKNRDYLIWRKEEIEEFLADENEKRKKEQRPILNSFKLWVSQNAILDSQTSVNLLANCFLGNTTLHHFVVDSEYQMLKTAFLESFGYDTEGDILKIIAELRGMFKVNYDILVELPERTSMALRAKDFIQGYYCTLKAFLWKKKTDFLFPKMRNELFELNAVLVLMIENAGDPLPGRIINQFKQLYFESRMGSH